MKHVAIVNYGCSVSIESKRLIVKHKNEKIAEYPLSRLKTLTIAKKGISFSRSLSISKLDLV